MFIVSAKNKYAKVIEKNNDKLLVDYNIGPMPIKLEEWVCVADVKELESYSLYNEDILNIFNENLDIYEILENDAYDIRLEEELDINISDIKFALDLYKNKNIEYQNKLIFLIKSLIFVINMNEYNIDLYVFLSYLIENKINDFNDIYNICNERFNNLNLPLKDRYNNEFDTLIILKNLFNIEGKYNNEINEAYMKFMNLECFNNNLDVIYIRAYSYYGGNSACPCDYYKAESNLKILYENGDCFAANSLGYIYYYGRVNNGIPQYDLAYKYFSVAAFNGEPEALIKISDMFKNGYGIEKNIEISFNILNKLESDEFELLEYNKPNKYADIALRLGSIYEYGLINEIDLNSAYHYYSMAKAAMKLRKRYYPMFGDNKVSDSINKSYDRIINLVNINKYDNINNILELFIDNNIIEIIAKYNENKNETIITFKGRYKLLYDKNGKSYFSNKIKIKLFNQKLIGKWSLNDPSIYEYNNEFIIEDDYEFVLKFNYEKIKTYLYNEV